MAPSKMRAQVHAIVAEPSSGLYWLGGGLTALALLGLAGQAGAEEKIITSHGYNFFGELEYGADFDHLRYVIT